MHREPSSQRHLLRRGANMFERFRRNDAPADSTTGSRTAVAERPVRDDETVPESRTDRFSRTDTDDTVVEQPRRGNGTATAAPTGAAATTGTTGTTGLTSDHM